MTPKQRIEGVFKDLHLIHKNEIAPTSFMAANATKNAFISSNREHTYSQMIGIETPETPPTDSSDAAPKVLIVLKENTTKDYSSFPSTTTYATVMAGFGNIGFVDMIEEPVFKFFNTLWSVHEMYRDVIEGSVEVQTNPVEAKGTASDQLTIVEVYYGEKKELVLRVCLPTSLLISYLYY